MAITNGYTTLDALKGRLGNVPGTISPLVLFQITHD